ncbi:nibrin [Trichonephila clavipes]|nr:nibrin [Trichonephila clavipes]
MIGHIYRDVILEQHVRLFRGAMGAEFLFVGDNTLSSPCKHCRRMPSIGGYHPYGLASILTGLESNRACVGYAWPANCSPSTPSHLSTGTSEGVA